MRLIINTTNIRIGGGLQVAYSIINELKHFPEHEYYILLSPQVAQLINKDEYPGNFRFYTFSSNPAYVYKNLFRYNRRHAKIEQDVQPDFVFTVFGPAQWIPKAPHLIGFANGYYLFTESKFIRERVLTNLKLRLSYYLHRHFILKELKKEGTLFWIESEDAKRELSKAIAVSPDKIFVAGNTYGTQYNNVIVNKERNETFTFLYLASNYLQKNLRIFNKIIPLINKKKIKCRFLLTLRKEDFDKLFPDPEIRSMLHNLGPIDPFLTPAAYNQADALFFPSLLETFSANYPEAMKMERPILTSDLPFARAVCDKAALYFDPYDPADIVEKIELLIKNRELQEKLANEGVNRLSFFDSAYARTQKLLNIMSSYPEQQ